MSYLPRLDDLHVNAPRYLLAAPPTGAQRHTTEILIVGGGAAGLAAALRASEEAEVVLLTRGALMASNSARAQGGIAAALDTGDTPACHVEDTLTAGAGLTAYGGYGAGLGHAAGAGLPHWLQVAAALAAGGGAFGVGVWRTRRTAVEPAGSFAADLAALERLVPTIRNHPDGLTSLQDLVDVLFEARHRSTPAPKPTTLVEQEGCARA